MPLLRKVIVFLICLLVSFEAFASKVVSVVDGDTLDAIIDGTQQRVRLAQIDTPERGQPFYRVAKDALKALAGGKNCEIEVVDFDKRWGRPVGHVVCDGVDVNLKMVSEGYAWAYLKYLTDQKYVRAEGEARAARRGLWKDSAPVPPWEWRNKKTKRSF